MQVTRKLDEALKMKDSTEAQLTCEIKRLADVSKVIRFLLFPDKYSRKSRYLNKSLLQIASKKIAFVLIANMAHGLVGRPSLLYHTLAWRIAYFVATQKLSKQCSRSWNITTCEMSYKLYKTFYLRPYSALFDAVFHILSFSHFDLCCFTAFKRS